MKALYKKEVGYYLKNPIGYIVVVLFAVFSNFMYTKDMFAVGSASLRPFFDTLPWMFMIFIPALTMRSLSEEKRANTIETLLALPLSETQIIMAKFNALLTVVAIALGLTLTLPVTLTVVSKLYLPEILVGYLGALCMAALFIAISMFFSSQTKNQVVALLGSILFLFFVIMTASDFAASVIPRFLIDTLTFFSPTYYLESFNKGIVDIRALFYFISFSAVFLLLTVIDLEKRD